MGATAHTRAHIHRGALRFHTLSVWTSAQQATLRAHSQYPPCRNLSQRLGTEAGRHFPLRGERTQNSEAAEPAPTPDTPATNAHPRTFPCTALHCVHVHARVVSVHNAARAGGSGVTGFGVRLRQEGYSLGPPYHGAHGGPSVTARVHSQHHDTVALVPIQTSCLQTSRFTRSHDTVALVPLQTSPEDGWHRANDAMARPVYS